MAASGVNDVLRAHQGAVKRFWNKINAVKTTAGTTSAFTLAFDVAPAAYADGEIVSFVVNATSAAAATIKVNALGAKALRLFGGNILAGALLTGQIVQARYNSPAGAFDIIPQNGWVRIGEQDPRGASAVDFTSIPAGVKHLHCMFALRPSTNGVRIDLQTDGADGVLDTAASDYGYAGTAASSTPATGVIGSGGNSSIILSETTNATGTPDLAAIFGSGHPSGDPYQVQLPHLLPRDSVGVSVIVGGRLPEGHLKSRGRKGLTSRLSGPTRFLDRVGCPNGTSAGWPSLGVGRLPQPQPP